MASDMSPLEATPDTIVFRPSKKRKIYRQRAADDDETASPPPPIAQPQSIDELIASGADAAEEMEGTEVSIAEILRLRKQKKRVGGVEFRAVEAVGSRDDGGEVVLRDGDGDGEGEGVDKVVRRFAPQTGIGGGGGGDVDRHMMAYIDSELAKRRSAEAHTHAQAQAQARNTVASSNSNGRSTKQVENKKDKEVQRQPATLGKLQEIDLGDEARDKNVVQTERARRRLDGEEVEDEGEKKPAKVRLGPDGKPWRGRKRRGSEDVKRDRLVEDVMRENRLEIYDELPVESSTINDDQAADDRIAEAFRREFMDAVSQRQRKKAVPAAPPARGPGGKKTEEELMKGPKLGGSRSARAAHMEMLKKQQSTKT